MHEGGGSVPAFGAHAPGSVAAWVLRRAFGEVVRRPYALRRAQKLRRFAARMLKPLVTDPPPYDVEPWPGVRLRLDPRDNTTDRQALGRVAPWTAEDEALIERAIASLPDGRLHYVDLGANVGIYASHVAALARRAGVALRAVCVEPQPLLVERLRTNLAFAGVPDEAIHPVGTGPAETSTVMDVSIGWNLGKASMLAERADSATRTLTIACRPLAAILGDAALERVDLMKVDIEGLEVPALSTFFRSAPASLHPARVLIEIAHDAEGGIDAMMVANGYRRTHANALDAIYELDAAPGGTGGGARVRRGTVGG